jgi:hypothetical protein
MRPYTSPITRQGNKKIVGLSSQRQTPGPAVHCRERIGVGRVPKGRLNVRMACLSNHCEMTSRRKFLPSLETHRIEFDERYLWDGFQPSLRDVVANLAFHSEIASNH